MKIRPKVLFIFLMVLLPIAHPASASNPTTKSFLWQVKAEKATVYLLGSLHYAKPDLYPLNPAIEAAFDASQVLYLEADVQKSDSMNLQKIMMERGMDPAKTLNQILPPDLLNTTHRVLEELGMPVEPFQHCKPWFLAFQVTSAKLMRLGWNPKYGVDLYFSEKARGQKGIEELEGVEFQLNLLSGMPDAEQIQFLTYTFHNLAEAEKGLDKVVSYWKKGDATGLDRDLIGAVKEDPKLKSFYQSFFVKRNESMAKKVLELLRGDKTAFVIVGAGHLIGPEGILALLQTQGYRSEQL